MNRIVSIALQTIGILGFNILYFNVFDDLSASRWVCWGYIHLTYALVVASVFSVKAVPNGHVYAYPKIAVASIYFIIALIVGAIMMIINCDSPVVPLVVFLIFTGIYLKLYLVLMATESSSITNEKRDKRYVRFVKLNAERLSAIRDNMGSAEGKKIIERAYDAIRGAEVTSVPAVAQIEVDIESQIDRIADLSGSSDMETLRSTVGRFVDLVRRRDAEIRLSK